MSSFTCTTCRRKKRKCDGARPHCGHCVKDGTSLDCAFETKKEGCIQKGNACLPCRRKKRKCDATHPFCGPCQSTGKESECVYKESRRVYDEARRLRELRPQNDDAQQSIGQQSGIDQPPRTQVSSTRIVTQGATGAALIATGSFTSAVSGISLDDLSLAFRVCFITHITQLGLVLDYKQQKAIVHGDLFSGVIHPFFIHFSHIFGCHYYQERKSDFMLLYLQSVYVFMTVESLSTIREDTSPLTRAIAHLMVSEMYLYTHHLDFGTHYLKLAGEIVKRRDIRFIMRPKSGKHREDAVRPLKFSEDVRQRIGFLAQLLYVDTDLFLIANQPSTMPAELEQEFNFELPLAYPGMCKTCPIVLRAKGTLLIKNARKQMSEFESEPIPSKAWCAVTTNVLHCLSSHIEDLVALIARLDQTSGSESVVCLRYSTITCLTSVAELHDLMAGPENSSRALCRAALSELMGVTERLTNNDYYLLDPYVGICWTRAISLIKKGSPTTCITQPSSSTLDSSADLAIKTLLECKARLDVSTRLVPSGPGSLCAKLVAMNEKLRTRCPDRVAPDEVNMVFRY